MAPRARRRFFLSLAACFFWTVALGDTPTTVGPIVIGVPDGFQHAQTQRQKKLLISAWTKSVRDGSMKTLLQINVVDIGTAGEASAEKYLGQFLTEVGRRRSPYSASPVAHIQLAGLPAVRATWNGSIGGRHAVGVMYSVIVRNRFAVILHTQDLGSIPTTGMLEAMHAIESVGLAGIS
jgi:hypothetical protein